MAAIPGTIHMKIVAHVNRCPECVHIGDYTSDDDPDPGRYVYGPPGLRLPCN